MSEAAKLAEMIKADVHRRADQQDKIITQMADAVTTVTNSVNKLITHSRLAEERHERQREENRRLHDRCDMIHAKQILIDDILKEEKILNTQLRSRLTWIWTVIGTGVIGGCMTGAWFVIELMVKSGA